jgi:ParB family transcriptional regulator, chromosome partitioning protein
MADNTEDKKAGKSSTKATQKPAQNAGLGLEGLGDLSSLLASPAAPEGGSGAPLELELALIDEDPHQPRKQFDENSLAEMAETIRARGVKTTPRWRGAISSTTARAAIARPCWPRK